MNKTEFLNRLAKELSRSKEECIIINNILEDNFFISKENKNKILGELARELEIEEREAETIYDVATRIIKDEIKYRFKHPFRSKN